MGAGVVLACSYEAKARGVRTAMGGGLAKRLCPGRRGRAAAHGGLLGGEQGGVRGVRGDRARRGGDLDRRGVPGRARDGAVQGHAARDRPRSSGARCAARWGCRSPWASRTPSSSRRWRAPSQSRTGCCSSRRAESSTSCTRSRWSASGAWARSPRRSCASAASPTVAEVARLPEAALVDMLGRASGRKLHALAHNRDPRPVERRRRRRSMGAQRALGRRPWTHDSLDAALVGLVDRLCGRLRAARRVCRTITLRLRFDDFSRATRSHTIAEATSRTRTILATLRGLLAGAMPLIERSGITLIGITLSNLTSDSAVQLALPLERASAAGPRGGRRARPLRHRRHHASRAAGPRPRHRRPAAAGLRDGIGAQPASRLLPQRLRPRPSCARGTARYSASSWSPM